MVCVPGVVVPVLTRPEPALITVPASPEYDPPAVPVRVTSIMPAFEQYGDPVYEIVAEGAAVIRTDAVV
jgi:hypothetical protein